MYKKVYLKRGKEASLKRRHPWIFSGAIFKTDPSVEEGNLVEVIDSEGNFIAEGHFQMGSIAVRVLSFEQVEIGANFFKEKLQNAFNVRQQLHLQRADNNAFRLVHGEGDLLPALIVDIYDKTAVVQAHSIGMHLQREVIADALLQINGLPIESVYYKSDQTLPFNTDLDSDSGYLRRPKGLTYDEADNNIATENGLRFHIDWLKGQKTGFFIDQRENRKLLEKFSQDNKVLNMFCYTGGFSVYAMRGGAKLVHSVDSSARAIEMTNANVALNFENDTRHTAYVCDAFKFLSDMTEDYDVIVLDPPAFAKHQSALSNALKGYARLNAAALSKIKAGGILFTFSCSQAVNFEQFRTAIFTAAARAGRFVRILHQLHQPADHPISIYHPEGEYLKGLVLYVE